MGNNNNNNNNVWQGTGCTCGDEIKQGQKTGRRSCCGEGGSWYNLCGMYDGVKQPHTWNEGLKACRDASQQNQNNKQPGKKPGKKPGKNPKPKPKPNGNKDKKPGKKPGDKSNKPGKKPGKKPKNDDRTKFDLDLASFLRGSGGQVPGNKGPQHNDAETNRTPDASIARHVSATFRDGVAFLTGFVCLLISSNVIV